MAMMKDFLLPLMNSRFRDLFKTIAEKGSIRQDNLIRKFGKDETLKIIDELKKADLIKESPSVLDDLNTYYLTSKGVKANREVK